MAELSQDRRALYLRWRPSSFADVVGQDHVVRTLRNAVKAGTPSHAYLLAGPRGTGKTSIARILYRAVNCTDSRGGDPCGSCPSCQTALQGRTLDLVEIDAASNRGIDDIRDLREKVAFSPSEVKYRVYIVDEAHELTGPAWDAFLKTLEEPPPHAIFVLATTEAHKIPGTIVSRCQRFDLRRIKPEAISQRLREIAADEGLSLEPAAADRLARMARGGLRDAISLLDQSASFTAGRVDLEALREALGLTDLRVVQQLAESVARQDAPAALGQLVEVAESGADVRLFADDLGRLLRGLLYSAAGAGRALAGEYSADELAWLVTEAQLWEPAVLKRLLRSISDGMTRIRDSGQFQLHLELAVLEACAAGEPAEPRSAPRRQAVPVPVERPASTLPPAAHNSVPEEPEDSSGAGLLPPDWPAELDVSRAPIREPEPQHGPVAADAPPGETVRQAEPRTGGQIDALSLAGIRGHWPRVMEWVGNRNLFVHTYLQPAELSGFDDDWLVLRFAFKVHYERVNEVKNRDLVEQACKTILGRAIRLRCEYAAPSSAPREELDLEDPVLTFALEKFGGTAELVDPSAR